MEYKGKPIAILVDFSHYISEKNEILTYYWNTQQLDSLDASWDFTESALFGYAVGKVLESFVHFQVGVRERAIAHFHEWMTGTALLYFKQELPHVGNGLHHPCHCIGAQHSRQWLGAIQLLGGILSLRSYAYRFSVQQ